MNLTLNNVLINLGIKDYDYIFDNKYFDVCENKVVYGNITLSDETINSNIIKYSSLEKKNIGSDKIFFADCNSDILKFVSNSLEEKSSNKCIYIGKVNDFLADKIFEDLGKNIKRYNISLKANNVKKIIKDHGNIEKEYQRGQIPVFLDDFTYIDDIILDNERFYVSGVTSSNKMAIIFEKNLDYKYTLVTYISDKHHNIEVQTMYKHKKKNSFTVLHE